MGMLFVVVAVTPVVLIAPLVLSFALQYLGRVLVSTAMGETLPPRSPDRNFDGFLNGLSPWCVWLVLGLGVGLLPAFCLVRSVDLGHRVPWIALPLILAALPYILASLMMSFLHDDPLAPKPWSVLLALIRLGIGFLGLTTFIAIVIGAASGTFGLALLVRPRSFGTYLLLGLGCSFILHWTAIVVMRLLGNYYYHNKDTLHWHRAHPRWGLAWRL